MCDLSWLKKFSFCSYTSPKIQSWIFETLWVIIFWVRVTHKMLNVDWEKIPLNNFMCDLSWLKKLFPYSYTSPQNQSWIFKTLWVIIFWVRVTHKMLNVNWENFHSIILCVTCHGLRNFAPAHTHPLKTIHEFLKPYELLYFWVRVTHKMLNENWEKIHSIILCVTCHGLRKFSPAHTHPLITIHEFLMPYDLLYF